jgi:pyruvate/2-oxoglutarate dehydrogenase complex dihydrolipoamide dehydrogenase (E3) component
VNYPGLQYDEQSRSLLCPDDYVNPTPKPNYHLAVVGAGPAGLISAVGAAGLGARVALIEQGMMGGDCLNVGCVPSKALLEITKARPDVSFDDAFEHLRAVRAGIAPHDSVARYNELGADVFLGAAKFDNGQLTVAGTKVNARRIVICTGAKAAVPPIPGLREANPLTNESIFDLTQKPTSLAILGAGAIGAEMATVFARLGVEVHLFELADRVLPLEIPAASAAVQKELLALGVHLHLGAGVEEIRQSANGIEVVAQTTVSAERLLVALGRSPNTSELDLSSAGVQVDAQGFIQTDDKLRTSNKKIYAAGDCTARLQFTHYADAQARVVVQNALFLPTASVKGVIVPRCTYTQPEVASVEVPDCPDQYDTYHWDLAELDRSRTQVDGGGFVEVRTKKGSDQIVAATIVADEAGELLASVMVLITNGLGLSALAKVLLPYPTRSEFLKRLADGYNRTRMTPLVAKIFKWWLR